MLGFVKQFIRNPKYVGAVAPSSKFLAEEMIKDINFQDCQCIIEYGPGTGVFTEKLIARKKEDTVLIVLENNKEFCRELCNTYSYKKNVIIIFDGAENIKEYLQFFNIRKVDYIISGLPFTVLPKVIARKILRNTKEILSEEGEFVTFQYSLLKKSLLNSYFSSINAKKVVLNLPPAYVLKCRVKE